MQKPANETNIKGSFDLGMMRSIEHKYGAISVLIKTLAHSPTAIEAYLAFGEILSQGVLSVNQRQLIARLVKNNTNLIFTAANSPSKTHQTSDQRLAGLGEITCSEEDFSILSIAQLVIANGGTLSNREVNSALESDVTSEVILEVIANVAFCVFGHFTERTGRYFEKYGENRN